MLSGREAHIPTDIAFSATADDDEWAGILPKFVNKHDKNEMVAPITERNTRPMICVCDLTLIP